MFSDETLKENPEPKCVYITPKEELAEIVRQDWDRRFSDLGFKVVLLTGENATDLKLIARVNQIDKTTIFHLSLKMLLFSGKYYHFNA